MKYLLMLMMMVLGAPASHAQQVEQSLSGLLGELNLNTEKFQAHLRYRLPAASGSGKQDTVELHIWKSGRGYRAQIPQTLDYRTDGRLSLSLDHRNEIAILDTFSKLSTQSMLPTDWALSMDSLLQSVGCKQGNETVDGVQWYTVDCPTTGYRVRLRIGSASRRVEEVRMRWQDPETGMFIQQFAIDYLSYNPDPQLSEADFDLSPYLNRGTDGWHLLPPYSNYQLEDLTPYNTQP